MPTHCAAFKNLAAGTACIPARGGALASGQSPAPRPVNTNIVKTQVEKMKTRSEGEVKWMAGRGKVQQQGGFQQGGLSVRVRVCVCNDACVPGDRHS